MTIRTMIHRYATAKTIPLVVLAVFLLAQIVWVSLSPTLVQAAPTISSATNGTMTSSLNPTGTKSVSFNSGSGTGRMLVVVVGSDDRTNKMTSVSYAGFTMTQAYATGQLAPSTATARVQLFYLPIDENTTGSNNVSFTASAADNYAYVIAYVSGADTTSVGTVNINSGTGSTLSVTNVPSKADSLIVTAFGSNSTTALSPSGGSTEVANGEVSATGIRAGMYIKFGGPAGTSISTAASGGNDGWGAISLEIKPPVVLPTVSVASQDDAAQEPGQETQADLASFMLMHTGDDKLGDIDVNLFISGSATMYDDYAFDVENSTCDNISGDSATIPANQESCTVVILPEYDEEEEDTETVEMYLDDGSDYLVGESGTRETLYIGDTPPGTGGGTINCSDQPEVCAALDYAIHPPGFASMYIYDEDTVPAGEITGPGLTATPTRVKSGGVATLSWSVTGMTSCSIDNGVGTVDATDGLHTATTPAITTRTTFTLTCSDGSASVLSRATVGIVPTFIEQ